MELEWGYQHEEWGLERDGSNLHEEIKWKILSGHNYSPQLSKMWTTILELSTPFRNGQNFRPQAENYGL
jgi:hypothetical protein